MWEASEARRCISAVVDSVGGFIVTCVPWAGLVFGEPSGQLGEETIHGTVLRGLGFGSSDDSLLCVRGGMQKAGAAVDEHVLVGASGEDRDEAVFGCASLSVDERNQTPQLNSRRREAGRGQRVSSGEIFSPNRADAGRELAEAYLWRVEGSKLQLE